MELERFKILINSESAQDSDLAIEEFGKSKRLDNDLLDYLLSIEETVDISDCLFSRTNYTKTQLKKIKEYIKNNIHTHSEPDFIFDLIDFAAFWKIDDFWDDCIGFIDNPDEDRLVILISINYIYERMTIEDLPQVKTVFDKVVNSAEYYQNCQTVAAFYLFRLTHDRQYYEYLKESMPLDNGGNKPVLKNLLNETYNQQEVFAFHDEMIEWI